VLRAAVSWRMWLSAQSTRRLCASGRWSPVRRVRTAASLGVLDGGHGAAVRLPSRVSATHAGIGERGRPPEWEASPCPSWATPAWTTAGRARVCAEVSWPTAGCTRGCPTLPATIAPSRSVAAARRSDKSMSRQTSMSNSVSAQIRLVLGPYSGAEPVARVGSGLRIDSAGFPALTRKILHDFQTQGRSDECARSDAGVFRLSLLRKPDRPSVRPAASRWEQD
jgi:hypothetical protein